MFNEEALQRQLSNFNSNASVVHKPHASQMDANYFGCQSQLDLARQSQQNGLQDGTRTNQKISSQYQQQQQHFNSNVPLAHGQHRASSVPSNDQQMMSSSSIKQSKRSVMLPQWLQIAINVSPPEGDELMTPVWEVYTRALGLVECGNTKVDKRDWVDTNRVMMLLMRSGIPSNFLAILWEFVNCTSPGQLTREECAALLALVSCVQAGQNVVSAAILQDLPEAVIPLIDHPALVPFIHQFQTAKTKQQHSKDSLNSLSAFPNSEKPVNNQINQTLSGSSNSNASNNQNFNDDEEEFSDFISPPLPSNVNIVQKPQSQIDISPLVPMNIIPTPAKLASNDVIVPSQASLTFGDFSPQNSNTSLDVKPFNLPQVNSSSNADDNSQDDDFEDFQSASSNLSGLNSSSGGGSPHLILPVAEKSSVNHIQSTSKVTEKSFAPVSTVDKNQPNSNQVPPATGLLMPMPSDSSSDKYAALRTVDFGSISPAKTDEDSFGDFISGQDKQANSLTDVEDEDFGDFASADFHITSTTTNAVENSKHSANSKDITNSIFSMSYEPNNSILDHSFDANISTVSSDGLVLGNNLKSNVPNFGVDLLNSLKNSTEILSPDKYTSNTSDKVENSESSSKTLKQEQSLIQSTASTTFSPMFNQTWMDGPPPLPCEETDVHAETTNDFGDFLSSNIPSSESKSKGSNLENSEVEPTALEPTMLKKEPKSQEPTMLPIQGENLQSLGIQLRVGELDCFGLAELPPPLPSVDECGPAFPVTESASIEADFSLPNNPITSITSDKYSSIRTDSEDESPSSILVWIQAVKSCSSLLSEGVKSLQQLFTEGDEDSVSRIVSTMEMRHFIHGLLEVSFVFSRIQSSLRDGQSSEEMNTCLSDCEKVLEQLKHCLLKLEDCSFADSLSADSDSVSGSVCCGVCLTPTAVETHESECLKSLSQQSSVQHAGHHYHASCANLWLNSVTITLPTLT